ncbi:MAG: hypothetical protein Q4Q53_01180 [Methanocorpusculum sp.]|nr:hypothetical protein [Methanocorpusculum sp.]
MTLLVILIIFFLLITAGCISNEEKEVETTGVETPSDMIDGALDFAKDLKNLDVSISIDLYNLADKFGSAKDDKEIEEIAVDYYSENAWIDKIIYYDAVTKERLDIPIQIDTELDSYLPHPTEEQLKLAGGNIHYDSVMIPEDGHVSVECAAVYDENGNYKGCFVFVYDLYVALNLHPMFMDTEKSYGNFICFCLDKNNKIVYSSKQEYIGETVDSYLNDGINVIKISDKESGAYTYKSASFYNYNRHFNTEKITDWEKFTAFKTTYTLYLTKELGQPPLIYNNIYDVNPDQAEKDVNDAYVYAVQKGNQALLDRINSGYYNTPMGILNYDGYVVSGFDNSLLGLNFLNNRGAYGYAYTKSMIYTAQQGGGYVYYMYPVDGTIDTQASQFSLGYIMPIPGDCFIFGRFSGYSDLIPKNVNIRNDVTSLSRAVLKDAYDNGADYVIDKISKNPHNTEVFTGNLTTNVEDLGILDYEGNIYASAYNPSVVGYTLTGYKDVYGGSTVRKLIMLAKSGGGYINELYPNPIKDGYVDLWLYSVEPIDDTYIVYTGAVIKTFEDISPDLAGLNLQ